MWWPWIQWQSLAIFDDIKSKNPSRSDRTDPGGIRIVEQLSFKFDVLFKQFSTQSVIRHELDQLFDAVKVQNENFITYIGLILRFR